MPPARLLAVLAAIPLVSARLLHSLPEDTYAFPKYKVSFLSQLPLANKTAEHWLKHGLTGGLSEFLDQPSSSHKRISSNDDDDDDDDGEPQLYSDYTLEHMRMGHNDSYLCLIPKALDPPVSTTPEPELDISPAHSWSLLEPLNGNCLYHRQGWFTYSYCHNSEIRQFKERLNPHLNAPGGYKPEEDPKWESYTLGRAPQTGTDVAVRDGTVQLANGGAGGSRYLVQTWGDGTMCDKSGKPREVQVQFHCSMTMSDHILFVKEAKTCSYVLVINTPRLCSEPGFKSTRDVAEQGSIQCREVVDEASVPQRTPTDGKEGEDYPRKMLKPKAQLPPPAPKDKVPTDSRPGAGANAQIQYIDILDKAMTALQDAAGLDLGNGKLVMTEDGGVVLEFINEVPQELTEEEELANDALIDRLMEVLKKAGIQLQGEEGEVEQEDEEDKRPLDEL